MTRPIVSNFDSTDYRYGHATHGYLPDRGPQPVFLAWGPDVKPGVVLDRRPIVDAPCTMAALLGLEMPDYILLREKVFKCFDVDTAVTVKLESQKKRQDGD